MEFLAPASVLGTGALQAELEALVVDAMKAFKCAPSHLAPACVARGRSSVSVIASQYMSGVDGCIFICGPRRQFNEDPTSCSVKLASISGSTVYNVPPLERAPSFHNICDCLGGIGGSANEACERALTCCSAHNIGGFVPLVAPTLA